MSIHSSPLRRASKPGTIVAMTSSPLRSLSSLEKISVPMFSRYRLRRESLKFQGSALGFDRSGPDGTGNLALSCGGRGHTNGPPARPERCRTSRRERPTDTRAISATRNSCCRRTRRNGVGHWSQTVPLRVPRKPSGNKVGAFEKRKDAHEAELASPSRQPPSARLRSKRPASVESLGLR